MKKPRKRLDRSAFWMWAVPLVLGLVLTDLSLQFLIARVEEPGRDQLVLATSAAVLIKLVVIIFLAIALARRFRDIGWPAWMGPTILLVIMLGRSFLVFGYVTSCAMSPGTSCTDDQLMQWLSLYGRIFWAANLMLLIVAGSVPGKPAPNIEVARVFD